jgi:hypothetical protein
MKDGLTRRICALSMNRRSESVVLVRLVEIALLIPAREVNRE